MYCAALTQRRPPKCGDCGANLSTVDFDLLYSYSRHVVYYGHQYRKYYEGQLGTDGKIRPSLPFIGDVFAWLGTVVLSGVIGNATYDVLKSAFYRIRENARRNAEFDKGCEAVAKMTDEEFEQFFEHVRDAHEGFKSVHPEVRADITEEILADAVSEDPLIAQQIAKLVFREEIKPKHRKRAAALYKAAAQKKLAMRKPLRKHFDGFWDRTK